MGGVSIAGVMRWLPSLVYLLFASPFACLAFLGRMNRLLDEFEKHSSFKHRP